MNNLKNILKKELREMFRDTKSLAMMLIIPIMIPLLIFGMSALFESQINMPVTSYNKIGFSYELSDEEKDLASLMNIDVVEMSEDELINAYRDGLVDLYVTKVNMGDHLDLPVNVEGVTVVSTNATNCNPSLSKLCCWQGNTASSCDSAYGNYSGCKRTVCDWRAADTICSSLTLGGYNWRLPTKNEMSNWDAYSIGLDNNGLQLCDENSGYSSTQCKHTYNCMQQYTYNNCSPYKIWSRDASTDLLVRVYGLEDGVWESSTYTVTNAYSVRCVADL